MNYYKNNGMAFNKFKFGKRSKHWTKEEKWCLVNLCKKYLYKDQAWEIIYEKYCEEYGSGRTRNVLRNRWNIMKSEAEIEINSSKKPSKLTLEILKVILEANNLVNIKGNGQMSRPSSSSSSVEEPQKNVQRQSQAYLMQQSTHPDQSHHNFFQQNIPFRWNNVADTLEKDIDFNRQNARWPTISKTSQPKQYRTTDDEVTQAPEQVIMEMQAKEHFLRTKILEIELETAKLNADIVEINKIMAFQELIKFTSKRKF